jgi:hypothetical protein
MSRHSFEPDIAAQVGLNAAVIYQNILWWAEKNAANDRHFHDGLWWTYNSIAAFAELFPYLTGKQIRTALDKLEQEGLLVSGSFNKSAYDRTKWYAPTCLGGHVHLPKKANEAASEGKPIPDSKPVVKPVDITPYSPPMPDLPHWMPLEAWHGWMEMRAKMKKPMTSRAMVRAINKLESMRQAGTDIAEVLDRSTMSGWTDLYDIKGVNNGTKHTKQDGVDAALDSLFEFGGSTRAPDRQAVERIGGPDQRAIAAA